MEPLKQLYDFRELALPEPLFQLTWDGSEVEAALAAVPARFLTIEEAAGPVQAGDFAVFDLPETEAEEAKRVQINVGKRFCDPAFEDALVGLPLGAQVAMPRRDAGRTGTLVQLKRRVYPPLTDRLISRMGLAGVETIADYREHIKGKLLARDKRKKAEAIYTMTVNQVVERSQFGDLSAEVDRQLERMEAQNRQLAQEHDMSYEELTAQMIPPQYDTQEKKDAFLRAQAEKRAKEHLAACRFAEQEGKVFTSEDFEAEKRKYLEMGMTRDKVEQFLPSFELFLETAPFAFFKDAVLAHFDKNFKVVEQA